MELAELGEWRHVRGLPGEAFKVNQQQPDLEACPFPGTAQGLPRPFAIKEALGSRAQEKLKNKTKKPAMKRR